MVIALALLNRPARAAGLLVPLPPVVRPMSRSCWETAVQLGYQTGSARHVALAAIEAVRAGADAARSQTLFGGASNDTLKGGQGNDYLDSGTGSDMLTGGGGAVTDFSPQECRNFFRHAGYART